MGWKDRPRWVTPVLNFAVSLVLGVGFTWLAMRDVDFDKVGEILETVEYWYVWPYVGLMVLVHLLRTWRWGLLLSPIAHVPFKRLLPISSVGFLAIVLLPFRMGEFVRPYLVADHGKLTFSAALATCVVERIVDALLVLGMLFAALATVETPIPPSVITSGYVALAAFGGLLGVILIALWKRDASIAFWEKLIGLVSRKLAQRMTAMLAAFIDGLHALRSGKRMVLLLLSSLAYWGLAGFGLYLLFQAFHLDLPFSATFIVNGILVVGIMVPGGPGFTGPFEIALKVALVDLFLLPESVNASYTIVLHALQFGFQLIVGVIFLFSSHVSFVKLVDASGRAASSLRTEEG